MKKKNTSSKTGLKNHLVYLLVFLKGLLMGFSDIIPGVSGGTIALITGIYQRLISAVNNLFSLIGFFFNFLRGKISFKSLKRSFFKQDWLFLFSLLFGILLAVILGSWLILFLLKNYLVYTLAFFIGLILVSGVVVFKKIPAHSLVSVVYLLLGLLIGLVLAFVVPVTLSHTWFFIVLAGFLAISAMFLPGISGSFILLIIGFYEFMINALHSLDFQTIGLFGFGALIGVFVISKLISYLFKYFENNTLSLLTGLIIGALAIPLKKIVFNWANNDWFLTVIFFLLGVFIVVIINSFSE